MFALSSKTGNSLCDHVVARSIGEYFKSNLGCLEFKEMRLLLQQITDAVVMINNDPEAVSAMTTHTKVQSHTLGCHAYMSYTYMVHP